MVSRAFDGRRRIGYYDGSYCDCRACGNRNTWTIRIRGTWLDILPPSGQHITPSAYSCALLVASALASLGCGITPPDYAFFGAESRAPCVLVCAVGVASMGIRRLSPFTFHLLPFTCLLSPDYYYAECADCRSGCARRVGYRALRFCERRVRRCASMGNKHPLAMPCLVFT